jgi:hypothetical protein
MNLGKITIRLCIYSVCQCMHSSFKSNELYPLFVGSSLRRMHLGGWSISTINWVNIQFYEASVLFIFNIHIPSVVSKKKQFTICCLVPTCMLSFKLFPLPFLCFNDRVINDIDHNKYQKRNFVHRRFLDKVICSSIIKHIIKGRHAVERFKWTNTTPCQALRRGIVQTQDFHAKLAHPKTTITEFFAAWNSIQAARNTIGFALRSVGNTGARGCISPPHGSIGMWQCYLLNMFYYKYQSTALQNGWKCHFRTVESQNFLGGHAPRPPTWVVPLATLLLPSKIYELPTPLFALDEMNNQKENVCIRITIFFLTKVQGHEHNCCNGARPRGNSRIRKRTLSPTSQVTIVQTHSIETHNYTHKMKYRVRWSKPSNVHPEHVGRT